jgi:hypothetical protein
MNVSLALGALVGWHHRLSNRPEWLLAAETRQQDSRKAGRLSKKR